MAKPLDCGDAAPQLRLTYHEQNITQQATN